LRDSAVPGLTCRVRPGGKPVWCFSYRHGKRQRKITMGAASAISAKDARDTASKLYARVIFPAISRG
jgi:hypothetical protein